MALIGGVETEYAPILAVRPAEMAALEELPQKDKNKLLPIILLRPWVTSRTLDKALERIETAVGRGKWVADFDLDYIRNINASARDVHQELEALKLSDDGYANWCEFVANKPNIIPSVQIQEPDEIRQQVKRLDRLGRGLVVRFQADAFSQAFRIAERVLENTEQPVLFVLDQGQMREQLLPALRTLETARRILNINGDITVAPSGSSFPFEFKGVEEIEILERRYFNEVQQALDPAILLYSDRGSARAEAMAGGGVPIPRIDYPLSDDWKFFRDEDGYQSAAIDLMENEEVWIEGLQVWGTQMIERTARGDEYAIESPVKATAVRINIHLHQQLHYGKSLDELLDTDDDWSD